MLEVKCEEHLEEVRSFAKERGIEAALNKTLGRLNEMFEGDDSVKGELYTDFAPHSFTFAFYRGEKLLLNGGLIFHENSNGDAPEWGIHT